MTPRVASPPRNEPIAVVRVGEATSVTLTVWPCRKAAGVLTVNDSRPHLGSTLYLRAIPKVRSMTRQQLLL